MRMAASLPTGTVTLVFTDMQGSTPLLQTTLGEAYGGVLARHRALLRQAFSSDAGAVVDTQHASGRRPLAAASKSRSSSAPSLSATNRAVGRKARLLKSRTGAQSGGEAPSLHLPVAYCDHRGATTLPWLCPTSTTL